MSIHFRALLALQISHSNLSNIFCLKKIEFAEEEVILCLKKTSFLQWPQSSLNFLALRPACLPRPAPPPPLPRLGPGSVLFNKQDVPGLPGHGVELHQLQADGRTPRIGSALHMLYVYDVLLALADDLAFTFSEQMDPATTLRVSALRNARSGPCLMTYYIKCLDGTSSGSIPSNSSGFLFGTRPVSCPVSSQCCQPMSLTKDRRSSQIIARVFRTL